MQNTFAYLLDNDNVVTAQQVKEYFTKFFTDFVATKGAELVEVRDDESRNEFDLLYIIPMCDVCAEAGLDACECVPEIRSIGYKLVDVYGNL
jgi:hypothetical protein